MVDKAVVYILGTALLLKRMDKARVGCRRHERAIRIFDVGLLDNAMWNEWWDSDINSNFPDGLDFGINSRNSSVDPDLDFAGESEPLHVEVIVCANEEHILWVNSMNCV